MNRHDHAADRSGSPPESDAPHDHATRDPAKHRPMTTGDVAAAYDDLADRLDRWGWLERAFTGRYRRRQFGGVDGRVLDVACGTGTNFRYLDPAADLVGVDVSPAMLSKAREELDRLGRDGRLREMNAQDLEFTDDSFDTVVSAFSTCTFPDPVAALREMARVCDPDGRIVLLEHGRSSVGPVARFQDWRAEAHYATAGCRWDQEPLALVAAADLAVAESWTAFLGIVTGVEVRPEGEQVVE